MGVMDGRWECQGGDDRWQVGVSGRVGESGVSGRWDLQVANGKVRVWGGCDSWQVGLRRRFGSQVAGGSVREVRELVWVRGECGD